MYELCCKGFIRLPEREDRTLLQEHFLSFMCADTLVRRENDSLALRAIAESLGVKFKKEK